MSQSGRRGGLEPALVFGGVLVLLGAALLLRNAGLLLFEWSVVWPLILVGIGLAILAGAFQRGGGGGESSVRIPRDGAGSLELELRLGAGRYQLRGGAAELVEVTSTNATIQSRVDRSGSSARVRLNPEVRSWPWDWRGGIDWRIAVAGDVPTALSVDAGAGDFDLDLSGVSIARARFAIGAAQLRVLLPRPRGEVPMTVEGGAAQFTFEVPAGVEARVTTTGLVSVSGATQTPGYATASDRVTVTVTGGAAAVRVVGAG